MDNNREVIKYIASSVWSSWNPINWSPTMQLAAVSYIFSCLIDDTNAYLVKDTHELSNSQNFTFHSTKYPASRYVELAKEIPVCLKILKIFHKFDPEYVPDKSLTSHRFIDNFSNLLEHFKLTSIKDSTDSNPNYLIAWNWAKNLGNIFEHFGQKLKRACNKVETAENYWENYEPEAFSDFSIFRESINIMTHCEDALLGCRDIISDIY
ncbi:hypothetical protein [Rickettsia endosymbiont of Rhinocyllus conicus]|uniref:hypothetical protein n=1 Tax=Rickettsia endosymbiont of Rhinocyllus conicus TaxID=3066252 RepID=UPI0031331B63